jgi:hypothetical protein
MKITEAKGPPGAEKLLRHIRESGLSIPKWCEEKGLDRLKVQKAINGSWQRFDVDFALSIERATGGDVAVADWATVDPGSPSSEEPAAQ